MGPEIENKQNTDMIVEASARKQNGGDSKELEASYVNCASSYENHTSLVGQVKEVHGNEDDEINITECTGPAYNVLMQSDSEELTESSSSFESITSEAENCTTMNATECTSEYNDDAASDVAFGLGDIFRITRKKVTSHWRDFIQPLRQRCKLIELKLHMLQSQARKYEKQMRDDNHQMKLQMQSVRFEDLGSKSLPFSCNNLRDKVVKRKKRRRTEDTLDVAAYMSHHPLFSYFEKRKSSVDGSFLDNEFDKIAICSDKINAEIQDDLQQQPADGDTSLEKILRKIGILQSHVIQLKTRLDKVTSDNGIFSSTDDLKSLLPCNALGSSAQDNQIKMPPGSCDVVSQLISEYNMVMPDSAASRYGKAVSVPDVVESTDRFLPLDSNINPEDDVLIYNQRMKEEMSNFEEFKIHSVEEKPQASEHVQKVAIPASDPDPEPDPDLPVDDQPAPKIRSISKLTAPKSKKRKSRRRAGSSKRSY